MNPLTSKHVNAPASPENVQSLFVFNMMFAIAFVIPETASQIISLTLKLANACAMK
jgi:hypothetical protein